MTYKFETVAIQHQSGAVSRMQIVVEAPASAFDARGAAANGFVFDAATQLWKRTLTPGMIQKEIARSSFPATAGRAIAHKKCRPEDFPAARQDFNAVPEKVG